ncbi:hypothetical protein ACFL6X_00145 [Candidatus Latescibacterota bacterium]
MPIRAAGEVREPVHTYELALPWDWLELHPEPEMVLDALFLFTDSDHPQASLRVKAGADRDKWIWWEGQVRLMGRPDGLEPPPAPEGPLAASAGTEGLAASARERIRQAVLRSRQRDTRRPPVAVETVPDTSPAPSSVDGDLSPGGEEAGDGEGSVDRAATEATRRYARSMRAVLARRPESGPATPTWVRQVHAGVDLTEAQVDSYVAVVTGTLARIQRQGINSRTDYLVIDMARGAATPRGLCQGIPHGAGAPVPGRAGPGRLGGGAAPGEGR